MTPAAATPPEVHGVDDGVAVDGAGDGLPEADVGEPRIGEVEPEEQLGLERHEPVDAVALGGVVDPDRRHEAPLDAAGVEVVVGPGEVVVLVQLDAVEVRAARRRRG